MIKTYIRHKSWTSSERLIYVQFTSCVYGGMSIAAYSIDTVATSTCRPIKKKQQMT